MNKILSISLILLFNYLLFFLGNIVYTLDTFLIIKVVISEFSFIALYTLIDKGNIKHGILYTVLSIILMIQFTLPFYNFLFYSKSVHIFSIIISSVSIILNIIIIRSLINKGFRELLSSRVSTFIATIVEVSFFSYLLNIGIQGILLTLLMRIAYIYIIPKLIIKNY